MKLTYVTDCHLDHVNEDVFSNFMQQLSLQDTSALVVSGDISVANKLVLHLSLIEGAIRRPVYFVCGNHDFWGSNVDALRKNLTDLSNMSQYIKYLSSTPYVQLSSSTALVGHDGWYDCRYGDARRSQMVLADWAYIQDFNPRGVVKTVLFTGGCDKSHVISTSQKLAHEAAEHVALGIKAALRYCNKIIIVTHVPPFQEAHIYRNQPASNEALPFYTNKIMGDVILSAATANPSVAFTVLCGHTHEQYFTKIRGNLAVHVGGAEYGAPAIAGTIEVS